MQPRKRDREPATKFEDTIPIKDLLFKQRKGKFLNHLEKERLKKYAQTRRKEKLNKK